MHIRVAGITIRIEAADPDITFDSDKAARQFLVEKCEPDISITARWGDLTEAPVGKKIFDSGSLWRLYRRGDDYLFLFTSANTWPVPYELARFNRNFTAGEIRFHRPYFKRAGSIYPLEYPLDELLVTHYLADGRGVEVHACGLVDRAGRGLLFAGQSEAGKTTVARLWQECAGAHILSDDRIVLREEAGRVWMHGTPWHGEGGMASPEKAPLDRLFLLRQGSENNFLRLKPAVAAARLLACSFPPFHSRRAMESVLGFLGRVASAIPCGELSFTPDERMVQYVKAIRE